MKQKKQQEQKTLHIRIKRSGYELSGILKSEYELQGIEMMEFEITGSSENAPYKIGDSIDLSKNEIKYHYTSLK